MVRRLLGEETLKKYDVWSSWSKFTLSSTCSCISNHAFSDMKLRAMDSDWGLFKNADYRGYSLINVLTRHFRSCQDKIRSLLEWKSRAEMRYLFLGCLRFLSFAGILSPRYDGCFLCCPSCDHFPNPAPCPCLLKAGFCLPEYCACLHAKLLQLCLTLCSPMDCSPPGSSVHVLLQARILEWVAVSSFRGSSGTLNPSLLCFLHWQVGY